MNRDPRHAYRDALGRWRSAGRQALALVASAGTQAALARVLECSQQAIARLVGGQARPSLELGARIEATLGIPLREWAEAPKNTTAGCWLTMAQPPMLSLVTKTR